MTIPDLQLTIRYRDRTHVLSVAAVPNQPQSFGRADFQRWFALPADALLSVCLLYTSPSPRDRTRSRMPSSA